MVNTQDGNSELKAQLTILLHGFHGAAGRAEIKKQMRRHFQGHVRHHFGSQLVHTHGQTTLVHVILNKIIFKKISNNTKNL